jgi:hypothetical protein
MAKIKQISTLSADIRKDYLETTAEKIKESYHAGKTLKMAFIRFAADSANLTGEDRAAFIKQMDSTPLWFPTNPSACRQHFEERKGKLGEIAKDYAGF